METKPEFNFDALPIQVTYAGFIVKDGWECDQWNLTIGKDKPWVTQYYTGLSYRKVSKFDEKMIYRRWGVCNTNTSKRIRQRDLDAAAKPVRPDNKSIMYCLLADAEACDYSFNAWCDNFGYSNDSIIAFETYRKSMEIGENIRRTFSRNDIQAMREALGDY